MAKQTRIQMSNEDFITLEKAVNKFNKKVRELERLTDDSSYLPETRNFKEVLKSFETRDEFNRIIKSMNNFSTQKSSGVRVTLETGQEISRWELTELNRARRRAYKNLMTEKETILNERISIGIGDERIREINRQLEKVENVLKTNQRDFNRIKGQVFRYGSTDYYFKQDLLFQKNFLEAIEDLVNLENYNILLNEVRKRENPTDLWNWVKDSEILADVFLWYDDKKGNTSYGAFASNDDRLNAVLTELDIDIKNYWKDEKNGLKKKAKLDKEIAKKQKIINKKQSKAK